MVMGKKKRRLRTNALSTCAPVEKAGGVSREAGAPVSGDATRRISAAADAVAYPLGMRIDQAAFVRPNRRI
jgi:hypothetical protein